MAACACWCRKKRAPDYFIFPSIFDMSLDSLPCFPYSRGHRLLSDCVTGNSHASCGWAVNEMKNNNNGKEEYRRRSRLKGRTKNQKNKQVKSRERERQNRTSLSRRKNMMVIVMVWSLVVATLPDLFWLYPRRRKRKRYCLSSIEIGQENDQDESGPSGWKYRRGGGSNRGGGSQLRNARYRRKVDTIQKLIEYTIAFHFN